MNDDLDNLISQHLRGAATREEAEALDARLSSEPSAAAGLMRAALLEAHLREVGSVSAGPREVEEARARAYRLRPRTPRRWLAGLAACLLVAAGVWHVARRGSDTSPVPVGRPVASSQGAAQVVAAGPGVSFERAGRSQPLTSAARLSAADRVRTGPDASAELALHAERARLRVGPRSLLAFAPAGGSAGGQQVELLEGAIHCDVEHRSPDRPLVIETPHGRVQVVGTQFSVTVWGSRTRVQVQAGTVRVTRRSDGSTVDVSGGEYVDVEGTDAAPGAAPGAAPTAAPAGRDMGEFWSVKVRPAGIEQ